METAAKSGYPELFEPIRLGDRQLRNRIVAPPMYQLRPITSPEGIGWYRRLAAGGAAWVTVEVTSVLRFGPELRAGNLLPLVEAIHEQGAWAGIQLFPVPFGDAAEPGSLTRLQIEEILEGYERAGQICWEAGFDAVEPHGAHGYLLNQFFMPDRNTRGDEYGGSLENRCRLGLQIVERLRRGAGRSRLLFYRHSPLGSAYGMEESLEFARRLVEAGVDVLDISPAMQAREGDLAQPFRRLGVPVIAVGGMENPEAACRAVREGRCDLVAIGRGLIADARWPVKVRDGREDLLVRCRKCNQGCFDRLKQGQIVYCASWERDEVAAYVRREAQVDGRYRAQGLGAESGGA